MKKLFLLLSAMLVSYGGMSQGVDFLPVSFGEACKMAAEQDKLIFVDCYAVWCQPCARMAEKVFPTPEAGEYFNDRFVCLKMDMEKGEGAKLRKKWELVAYPTFLLVRPDGTVQHRIVGARELSGLIEEVELGLNEKTSMVYLAKVHEQREMTIDELMDYWHALKLASMKEKRDAVREELLGRLSDEELTDSKYWALFSEAKYGSSELDFVRNHIDDFRRNNGREAVDKLMVREYESVLLGSLRRLSNRAEGETAKVSDVVAAIMTDIEAYGIEMRPVILEKMSLVDAYTRKDIEFLLGYVEEQARKETDEKLAVDLITALILLDESEGVEYSRIDKVGDKLTAKINPMYRTHLQTLLDSFAKKS